MRKNLPLRLVAIIIAVLVMSIPVALAEQLNLVHDKRGNLVSGDSFFREYNEFNQLVRIRNGSTIAGLLLEDYTYHPTQERVLIKHVYNNSGGLKETIYYISDEFVRVKNTTGTYDTVYVKVDGQLVAQKNPDGSTYFIHGDHLGSSSVVTDSLGNAIENTSYEPFGGIFSGGSKTRFDYEGKEFDSVVGDYDFHARRYSSKFGQFITPDTLIQNVYDPQSLNRYFFERNNPYKNVDLTGHFSKELFIGGTLAVIGGAITLASVTAIAVPGVALTIALVGVFAIGSGLAAMSGGSVAEEGSALEADLHDVTEIVGSPFGLAGYTIGKMAGNDEMALEGAKLGNTISDLGFTAGTIKFPLKLLDIIGVTITASGIASRYSQNFKKNDKFSYNGGNPEISDNGKTIKLGRGGKFDNFECYVESCSRKTTKKDENARNNDANPNKN